MSGNWTITPEGVLIARNHLSWERYLLGLPMLLTGLWFLGQYLVLGLVEFVVAGDFVGIFKNFIGWIVMVVMGGSFLVPGWILCFLRRGVLLEPQKDRFVVFTDLGVWRSRKEYALSSYSRLVLLSEPSQSSKSGKWSHTLHLADEKDRLIPLDSGTKESSIEEMGLAMAGLLNRKLETFTQDSWSNR